MTRSFQTSGAPHMPPQNTVAKVMLQVLLALTPGVLAYSWFFGPGILIQIILATLFALLFEAIILRWRGRPLKPFINDYSAVVTAVLFALCIPPLAPWWISCIAMLFAIVFAKHLYGGLGQNVFNPAMVGYVVVLISFPQAMTAWLPPLALAQQSPELMSVGLLDTLLIIFSGAVPIAGGWDAITQATPLDTLKTGVEAGRMVPEIRNMPLFGDYGGMGWEWIANWFALGGLYLLYKRIIGWQVPVAMIATVVVLSLPFWLADPDSNPFPLQHVFSGAIVLGAFFIATDPVSGCVSNRGRLIFGAGVAVITLVIRRWGGYPDGVAFAVLLMNMAATADRPVYTAKDVRRMIKMGLRIIRSSLLLGVIALMGTALLAGVNALTHERIIEQEKLRVLQQLNEIVPVASFNNDLLEDRIEIQDEVFFRHPAPVTVYRARMDGKAVAIMMMLTAPDGYNGDIRLLAGIDIHGTVLGVRVIAHKETPGLGDPIEIERSDWILGFTQKSLADPQVDGWNVKRDGGQFDQFTGATITPRAVVKATHRALQYFEANTQALFDTAAIKAE